LTDEQRLGNHPLLSYAWHRSRILPLYDGRAEMSPVRVDRRVVLSRLVGQPSSKLAAEFLLYEFLFVISSIGVQPSLRFISVSYMHMLDLLTGVWHI
jgi:hypothetical protein